ncbi:MAG: carboxypeptidase regulatory-like domain-containing protein [Acidobacteria bacterium]|nr:carboxypeptidase regulatory-like domain-containing protein [Acidobacteriota bacterium]
MRKLAGLTAIVILVALTATTAAAQQGTAELRGSVQDEQGGALPGVAILITNQDSGTFREALTGGDGSFFASQMLPGTFTITAQLPGFRTFERTDFAIGVGRTLDLDIVMTIGQLEETITVSGEAPLVDLTSAEVGGTINSEDLTEVPLGNRSYFSAVALLPGIQFNPSSSLGNDSIIANGQHPSTTNVQVDGSANNDDNSGTSAGGQTRVALESVQEFQVITNQFDAEFGRASGAVVNSITKRGSNEFSGALFNYYTSSAMTTTDVLAAQQGIDKPPSNKREFGGVIGGPILQDRMHFFFSLERQLVAPGRPRVFPDERSDLNYSTTESWEAWNSLIRADHQINSSNSWAFRWLRELAPQFGLLGNRTGTLATLEDETDNDQTYVGSWTSVLGSSQVNTVRVSATREQYWRGNPCWRAQGDFETLTARDSTAQANCLPQYRYQDFQDNALGSARGNRDHHWSYSNTFSWFVPDKAGDHDIKMGGTFHRTNMLWRQQSDMNGLFEFGTNRAFHRDDFSTYPEVLSIRVGGQLYTPTRYNTLEAYAQDKWQISDRMTFNLGVRYDLEVFPLENPNNPWAGQFNGGPEGTYPIDYNNVSPRTSFAYDVEGDGRSVVRGGYGIFYDKTLGLQVTRTSRLSAYSDSYVVRFPATGVDPGPGMGMRPGGDLGRLINTTTSGCPAEVNSGGCATINRDYLHQLYPPGSLAVNTGRVWFDHPDRKQAYSHQITFGYERELTSVLSASVDFVSMHGRDRQMLMEARPQVRAGTLRADPVTRMDALMLVPRLNDVLLPGDSYEGGRVNFVQSLGSSKYNALNFQVEKRYSSNWQMRAVYSLSKSEGNSTYYLDNNWAQVGNDLNIDQLWGPSVFDRRHNVTLSGRTEIPVAGGITLSGALRYMSGAPFTIHDTNFDPNMNGWGPDPIAAGPYNGDSGTGRNPITVDNAGGINGAYGPDFMQFDIRLGHRSRWADRQTLDIFFDVFNVLNRGNFNNPSGDMRSSNFLNLTSLRAGSGFPRQAQFGIRWGD